ncbi:MAG: hypothetical protein KatS3mg129_1625 [Leptospiraceae bacterium]|nr:MAG: hypothetical protein KatS3mg129_1625 [Leptospiraceae bacterium]
MNQNFTYEDLKYNRSVKKAFFEVLLEQTETFYIHCLNHTKLLIGTRGLLDREKKDGIILVFGPYSYRKLDWNEEGIFCEMNFGKWESVYIPYECIFRVFDKAGHFMMQFITMELLEEEKKEEKANQEELSFDIPDKEKKRKDAENNVIKIDFSKKQKKKKE